MFASVSVGFAGAAGVTVAFATLSAIAAESAFGSPFEQAATSEIALTSAIPRVDRMFSLRNEVSPSGVQDRHLRGEPMRSFERAEPNNYERLNYRTACSRGGAEGAGNDSADHQRLEEDVR